jgi:hypothetical protein
LLQRLRELERRLPAKLHDDAHQFARSLFALQNFKHVFGRQWFEIEPVRRVVIGRNGFRIAIDHDRFIAGIGQCVARVAAAIVEFDALADPVRTAAEDGNLLAIGRLRFVRRCTCEGRGIG